MRMTEVHDLMESWKEAPPPAMALSMLTDLVFTGLTGEPRKKEKIKPVTAEEFASAIGLKLSPKGGADGR